VLTCSALELCLDSHLRSSRTYTRFRPLELVFIWDGQEYAGEFRLPEIASSYQEDPNRRRFLE